MNGVLYLLRREGEAPPGAALLSRRESERLGPRATPKRRADFRLGRFTAREALGSVLGFPESDLHRLEVLPDGAGAPQAFLDGAPLDLCLSISHAHGASMAAVSRDRRVGADVEAIAPRDRGLVEDFFTDSERRLALGVPTSERDLLVNLLFSAKESAAKLLREGLRLDTRSLEVSVTGLTGDHDRFRPLAVTLPGGGVASGWWWTEGPLVLTVVSEPASVAPVALRTGRF